MEQDQRGPVRVQEWDVAAAVKAREEWGETAPGPGRQGTAYAPSVASGSHIRLALHAIN
ncbi:MAG: hypothetical protein U9Q23_00080 [Candidatus Bipolaricaulota bacterium]|nr:hypothetical protein [Candidatus Bipolaricaulota bacterium]